jgi:hypothetical protein
MVLPGLLVDVIGFSGFLACIFAVATLLRGFPHTIKRPTGEVVVSLSLAVLVLALKLGTVLRFEIPDSAEYLGIASRLVHDDTFLLHLNGRDLPSRYQPWFSWFLIYPFMRLTQTTWTVAIVPPFFAILGVYASALLAAGILPEQRKALALSVGAGVVLVPAYLYFSGHLMTDVPATVLSVLLAAAFCAGPVKARPLGELWAVGILGSFLFSLRPVSVVVLLPFLVELRRARVRLLPLIVPTVVIAASSLWLNYQISGDALRSGYNLWVAIPYDYFGRTFSVEFLSANVDALVKDPVFVVFVLVGLCPLSKNVRNRLGLATQESRAIGFVFLALVPQLILHLVYFYSTIRFSIALEVICGVLVACRIASIVSIQSFARAVALFVLVVGFVALPGSISAMRQSAPAKLLKLKDCAPKDAVLVSARHPVLTEEYVVRGSARTIMPMSRRTELASKVLVWSKVKAPVGVVIDPRHHRAEWLLQAGAEEVYPHVAVDQAGLLRDAIRNGSTVVVDTEMASSEEIEALRRSFILEPICAEFQKLVLLPLVP